MSALRLLYTDTANEHVICPGWEGPTPAASSTKPQLSLSIPVSMPFSGSFAQGSRFVGPLNSKAPVQNVPARLVPNAGTKSPPTFSGVGGQFIFVLVIAYLKRLVDLSAVCSEDPEYAELRLYAPVSTR